MHGTFEKTAVCLVWLSREDNVAPGESLAAKEGVHFTEHAVRNCWKFLNRNSWVEKMNVWMFCSMNWRLTAGRWCRRRGGCSVLSSRLNGETGRGHGDMCKDSSGLSWLMILWTFKFGCPRRQWCLRQERAAYTRKGLGKRSPAIHSKRRGY